MSESLDLFPKRLISTEEKVDIVTSQICSECTMMYRANKDLEFYNMGGDIDVDNISFDRFCDLSINALLCEEHQLSSDSTKNDVKFSVLNNKKEWVFAKFKFDSQIPDSQIDFEFDDEIKVIGFKKSALENLVGLYPYDRGGLSKMETAEHKFTFKIEIVFDPLPTNLFHCEVKIMGNHSDKGKLLESYRSLKNGKIYMDEIIKKLRDMIVLNEILFEVN